ncbi:unnamed protein product [Symbiodinium natans]|uniref:Transmembrane protein n=1 Tax=Symbiodinium natans TaxID=878477 RepID=A0A812USC6_9DINO|nr:unnamed protein product [Symbiodinium natans]
MQPIRYEKVACEELQQESRDSGEELTSSVSACLETCALLNSDSESEEDDELLNSVPPWLNRCVCGVPAEVQRIVKEKNDSRVGRKLTMFDTAGPAVRLLWPATILHICFAAALPWLARPYTRCEGDGKSVYPGWLWLGFLPFVLTMLAIEWRCFTFTVVPMLQWIQDGALRATLDHRKGSSILLPPFPNLAAAELASVAPFVPPHN